jgi:hypothetical protein
MVGVGIKKRAYCDRHLGKGRTNANPHDRGHSQNTGEIKKRGYPPWAATAGMTMLEIIDLGEMALTKRQAPRHRI